MHSKSWVSRAAFACALLFGSGRGHALVRETGLDFPLDIRWLRSDGEGGVFVRNGDELWTWDGETRLLRYAHPRGWEEAVAWPALSPWEKTDLPFPPSRSMPASLWAMSPANGDTLGLFLASGNTSPWRSAIFTLASLSGSPLPIDTLPFPQGWTGPGKRENVA
jgi:hypothetical protein